MTLILETLEFSGDAVLSYHNDGLLTHQTVIWSREGRSFYFQGFNLKLFFETIFEWFRANL